MKYRGRVISIVIVAVFNIVRYFYYHEYLALPFKGSFFILTAFFIIIAWWGGLLYDRAVFYSTIDPLTNTYNRRKLEQSFNKLASESIKNRKKLGIIIIDLDNFKQINDTFGHNKGDEVLQHIASTLTNVAKQDDIVGRWGGDEFLILTPNIEDNYKENYKNKLEKQLYSHNAYNKLSFGVSIGVAIYPDQGNNFEDLIQQADAQMYKMKRLKLV